MMEKPIDSPISEKMKMISSLIDQTLSHKDLSPSPERRSEILTYNT